MSRNAFPAIERELAEREDQAAHARMERNADKPVGLRDPWQWVEPANHANLVQRLQEAAEYNVPARERELLCSVAARAITNLLGAK